ncbi:hypothetical protein S-CBS2_gp101 [Synechococcus phage S-CBS2]|uniref:hypothetical protein n=1 Tax=Synechococcus phage S-CBS2 TaxID=753084 RepID=UPI0002078443|nr:hypothetical protein S-CBS2_gp101 [Synechococcus phage S-CBS2]ADF42457.1 hypothetical protein S-CBS2_gp101 [Synechococcus phage S-CBS2]
MTKKVSLTLSHTELLLILEAMAEVDTPVYFDGNDELIAKYDDLYDRITLAYRKAAGVE